jgi:hypothetical protein
MERTGGRDERVFGTTPPWSCCPNWASRTGRNGAKHGCPDRSPGTSASRVWWAGTRADRDGSGKGDEIINATWRHTDDVCLLLHGHRGAREGVSSVKSKIFC